MIKRWLGICRSTTTAILHHPNVIDIPTLSEYRTQAKLTFLSSVCTSNDPVIKEISSLFLDKEFFKDLNIPRESNRLLDLAKSSLSSISSKSLRQSCRKVSRKWREGLWNSKLDNLTVQNKFSDITELESQNWVWNCIRDGLPVGLLSFLLHAGSDSLPTPMNLRRWKIKHDAKCPLCDSPWCTTHHIPNGCPVALSQGRFTWRHDCALKTLASALVRRIEPGEKLYVDLPGYQASDNPPSTIPSDILVTSARPDIVLVRPSEVILLKLTIPYNSPDALSNAKERKETKQNYQLVLSDLDARGLSSTLFTIEIGALGHWLPCSSSALRQCFPPAVKIKRPILQGRW